MDDNALQVLVTEFRRLLVPLAAVTDSGAAGQLLFEITGWESTAGTDLATDSRLAQFKEAYQRLDALIDNPPQTLPDVLAALDTLQQLFSGVRQLPFQPGPIEAGAAELASDLVQALLLNYLQTWHPTVFDILVLLTIVQPPAQIAFDRVSSLFSDPRPVLRGEYLPQGLATAEDAKAAAGLLFPRLASLLADLGFHAAYASEPDSGVVPANILPQIAGGTLTVFLQPDFETPNRYGVALALSSQDIGNLGLVVLPFGNLLPYWDAGIDLTDYAAGFAIGPNGLTVFGTVGTSGGNPGLGGPALPGFVLGSTTGTRLEIAQFQVAATVTLGASDTEYGLIVDMGSSTLVISPGEGDSFLQDILPADGARANVDLAIGWSSKKGFYFRGAAGLEATLPLAVTIGDTLTIRSAHLLLQASNAAVAAEGSADFSVSLGPVSAALDRVGLTGTITFPQSGGNLGLADVDLRFAPPTGVGLAIDAGVVTGGGFLEHTGDEYGGALALLLQGTPVQAYGLIQTKLPGGQPGYSFIAVISAEFLPPVTLPFGFLLEGVGGLIGINRTISQSAVESALWAHHLDGLLFPANPVASAPQLLSALDTYFPAAQGRYVIGPMVKIGWSANLVLGEVAVLLELPEPLTVLLIGDVQVTAPLAVPQLILHISFAGGIDFGAKLAFFDATLHDSKLAGFPLSGDLAFRYGWGDDDAVFALAVGGFNPQFQPPAAFPALKRLAISVSSSVAKLDAQGYLALTSNTLQFGARAELTAGTGGFNVHGWLGFDALFEKDPLSFEFDLSAGVDLRSGSDVLASVHLDGKLSGPTPWHISGKASVSLLFFHASVHFSKTWGGAAGPVSVPDPLAALVAALAGRSGWSAQSAPGVRAAITPVAAPADAGDAVLLDPAGALRIAQRAVPLDQPITRFGGVSLGRTVSFSVDSLTAFGQPAAAAGTATEEFAAAQFLDFTDAEKLSLPSFSRFDAGVDVGASAVDLGTSGRNRAVLTRIGYDTIIIDTQQAPPPDSSYRPGLAAVLALNGSASRLAPGLGRYAPAPGTPPRVTLAADQWVVASTTDLGRRADIPSDGTKLGAHLALQRYLSANPGDAGGLQIVLASEAG